MFRCDVSNYWGLPGSTGARSVSHRAPPQVVSTSVNPSHTPPLMNCFVLSCHFPCCSYVAMTSSVCPLTYCGTCLNLIPNRTWVEKTTWIYRETVDLFEMSLNLLSSNVEKTCSLAHCDELENPL